LEKDCFSKQKKTSKKGGDFVGRRTAKKGRRDAKGTRNEIEKTYERKNKSSENEKKHAKKISTS